MAPKAKQATPKVQKVVTKKGPKLRSSIKEGAILILLSGRFRGKRVIFLKQLDSGLLLVTGPMKVNGVPLRRVNQRYVIATKTAVDVKKVDVKKIDDKYFNREKTKKKKSEDGFFSQEAEKPEISGTRKADQKAD